MEVVTRDGAVTELDVTDEPTFSYADGSGFVAASIPCATPDRDLKGGIVRIDAASPWFGLIDDMPAAGSPLEAIGYGYVGAWQRREALYRDQQMGPWADRTFDGKSSNIGVSIDGNLRFQVEAGRYLPASDGNTLAGFAGAWRTIPRTTSSVVSFSWSRPDSPYTRIRLYAGLVGAVPSSGMEATWGLPVWGIDTGKGGSATVPIDKTHDCLMFVVGPGTSGYTAESGFSVYIASINVYGVPDISPLGLIVNTTNVLGNILDNEIDTHYLPAGRRGFIGDAGASVLSQLAFGMSTPASKIETLQSITGWRFGWYSERVGGRHVPVPVWEPPATVPSYRIDLDETGVELDTGTLEPMASAVDVVWSSPDGRPQVTRVYDTDPTHRLVALGMDTAATAKVVEVAAQVTTTAAAQSIGALALQSMGRDQLRGSGPMIVRDLGGNIVPASRVRPNRLAIVSGAGRKTVAMVREVKATGDALCEPTLDNSSYRLDVALARLAAR